MKFAFTSSPQRYEEHMEMMRKAQAIVKPAIPFYEDESPKKKKEDVASGDDDKKNEANFITFECKLDPTAVGNDAEVYKKKVKVLGGKVTPEDWCKFRHELNELYESMAIDQDTPRATARNPNPEANDVNANKRHYTIRRLLSGSVKQHYEQHLQTRMQENEARPEEERLPFRFIFKLVLNDVARVVFPDPVSDHKFQVRYLKLNLFMGHLTVQKFTERLELINRYLPFFPKYADEEPKCLTEDELIEVLDAAMRPEWYPKMIESEKLPVTFRVYNDFKRYLEVLEKAHETTKQIARAVGRNDKKTSEGANTNKRKRNNEDRKQKAKMEKCIHCGKPGHLSNNCWYKDKKESKGNKYPKVTAKDHRMGKDLFALAKVLANRKIHRAAKKARADKKKSRKETVYQVDSDTETVSTCSLKEQLHCLGKLADENAQQSTAETDIDSGLSEFEFEDDE